MTDIKIKDEFTPCERLGSFEWKWGFSKKDKIDFCNGCHIRERCEDREESEELKLEEDKLF